MTVDLLRNLSLAVPLLALLVVVALRRRGVLARRQHDVPLGLLVLLFVWVGALAVEQATDLWAFAQTPTTFLGMPLETSLGWAVTWGLLPVLAGGRRLLWFAGLAWFDVLVMPQLQPLVVLGPQWWRGELLVLLAVAAPALFFGLASVRRRWLAARVLLQMGTSVGLVLWVVPTAAFEHGPGEWAAILDHSLPVRTALLVAAVVLGVPALAAVAELARVGGGTPYPWDPPERLVTTGPYAYLANPMQVSASALLLLLGLAAGSPGLLAAGAMAAVFSLAIAGPHERHTMRGWAGYPEYRRQVPAWLPRWRPYVAEPSDLWVSQECGLCRATGEGLAALRPTGLVLRPAEGAAVRLTRMRWVGSGTFDRGVAAFARALEQTHLALAWLGWVVRLPGVTWVVQVVADGCGLGPQELSRRTPSAHEGTESGEHRADTVEADGGRGQPDLPRGGPDHHGPCGRRRGGREPGAGLLPLRRHRGTAA